MDDTGWEKIRATKDAQIARAVALKAAVELLAVVEWKIDKAVSTVECVLGIAKDFEAYVLLGRG